MSQDYQAIALRKSFSNEKVYSFSHFAMATVFEIFISGFDHAYAEQASQADGHIAVAGKVAIDLKGKEIRG